MKTVQQRKRYYENRFDHEIARRERRKALAKARRKNVFQNREEEPSQRIEHKLRIEEAPEILCLFSNTEQCISFFTEVESRMRAGDEIYFDMSGIKRLDASSVIYLLSIFKNMKHNSIEYHIRGNVPKSAENYSYLRSTGFFSFVSSNVTGIQIDSTSVMIKEGEKVLNNIASSICDFIMEKTGRNRIQINHLYELIIELMNNTKHHAYDHDSIVHNWYIYCHEKDGKVQVVFFDNGAGIPSTVNKSKYEELQRWLNDHGLMIGGDVDILEAALDGAFRTRTMEEHRGKGLPMLKMMMENKEILNTYIVTNRAYYSGTKKRDMKESLHGTLYYWEVA